MEVKDSYVFSIEVLGYEFQDLELLKAAMLHPSHVDYNKHNSVTYEKLEFLGDAVLSLVITAMLIVAFPEETEGDLSKRRSHLVSGDVLSEIARKYNLGDYINMSAGEARNHGKESKNNLKNAMESIIGAVYLDGGIDAAMHAIQLLWCDYIQQNTIPPKDPKSALQEITQAKKLMPIYTVIKKSGAAHSPMFTVEVSVGQTRESGVAGTKKEAEMIAATKMLQHFIDPDKK